MKQEKLESGRLGYLSRVHELQELLDKDPDLSVLKALSKIDFTGQIFYKHFVVLNRKIIPKPAVFNENELKKAYLYLKELFDDAKPIENQNVTKVNSTKIKTKGIAATSFFKQTK